MSKAAIIGTGLYVPNRKVENSFFNDLYKKDIDTFLREQRNIQTRYWMEPEQCTSDLILPAAEMALKNARLEAKDLDMIIVATDTPDYLSPSTASVVQYKLKAERAGTFDLNSACAGFVTALDVASKYIRADQKYKNILVIGAYGMSKYLNLDDYKIATLFADGAGAVVVQSQDDEGLGVHSSELVTYGEFHDFMGIYAGGTKKPITHSVVENREQLLSFPKRIPPETNGIHWPVLAHKVLDRIQKKPSDVDHYVLTQFNIQSIYETLDKLNVPREKSHNIMNKFGYTGSASIPMAIADAAQAHKFKKGDLVLLIGSGGGMSMASVAMTWGYDT